MSAFKVGQRVRIISADPESAVFVMGLIGREGSITAIPSVLFPGHECDVCLDGVGPIVTMFFRLRPLTDPGADALIAELRQFSERANKEAERLSKVVIKEAKV